MSRSGVATNSVVDVGVSFGYDSNITNVFTSVGDAAFYARTFRVTASNGGPPPADPFVTWQNVYFTPSQVTNPNYGGPNADPDGDGMLNTNEFLAGFNPTNAAAYVHVISAVKSGGDTNMTITYLGANGNTSYVGGPTTRTNVLDFTTGTGNGSYTNNFAPTGQTNILSGGSGVGLVTNMVDTGGATNIPSRYYRVRVLTP